MTDCIPILQTEHLRYLGLAHECVWNETVIVAAILGLILFMVLIAVISALSQRSSSSHSGGGGYGGHSGYEVSSREVLNINPEKHQRDVFNLVNDILKISNSKVIESRSPDYVEFEKGSNWMHGKIRTKVQLSNINNKLVLNISSSKNQNWSHSFQQKEIEDFNRDFDRIISDINKIIKMK